MEKVDVLGGLWVWLGVIFWVRERVEAMKAQYPQYRTG